jgi:transcriptional regulator with XRE-family HTH domain
MGVGAKVLNGQGQTNAMAATLLAIGQRIRKTRSARSMTLQDLAAASGVSTPMLSLIERGRVAPSIGSLIMIAEAFGMSMSDLIADDAAETDQVVVREADQRVIEHAKHVIRRLIRDDRKRAVSIAVADFPPNSDSTSNPHAHTGFEYGYILDGKITVEIEGTTHILEKGDLISYNSKSKHRIWNPGKRSARTLWFNLRSA